MYHWEKVGKKRAEPYRMAAFRDFIFRCSLMDLESKGCAFTWKNNRTEEHLVKKHLDRALCTSDWRIAYPNAECTALPAIGSNHSPLILSLNSQKKMRRKIFRYEAF